MMISSTSVWVITARAPIAPPKPERAGVAHEDRGGEGVVPEEADAGADQAGGEQRQVLLLVGDEGDRRVGEQDDRAGAGGEAVEAVGQVDPVGGAGDDEEDEDEVEDRAEVDAGAADAEVEDRLEADLVAGDPPEAEGEDELAEQLPARREAERAAFDDLDVVVGEAERGAAHGDAEDGQALRVAVGEDEVGDADRGEDDQPAHRRRAGLGVVLLRPVLADVLPELAHPQVFDELGAEEDADQHRRHPRDQDFAHHRPPAPPARSATASRPAEREPLTRTASPGSGGRRAAPPPRRGRRRARRGRSPAPARRRRSACRCRRRGRARRPRGGSRRRRGRARPSRRARRRGAAPRGSRDGRAPRASTPGWRCSSRSQGRSRRRARCARRGSWRILCSQRGRPCPPGAAPRATPAAIAARALVRLCASVKGKWKRWDPGRGRDQRLGHALVDPRLGRLDVAPGAEAQKPRRPLQVRLELAGGDRDDGESRRRERRQHLGLGRRDRRHRAEQLDVDRADVGDHRHLGLGDRRQLGDLAAPRIAISRTSARCRRGLRARSAAARSRC